ncbi:MAG: hypothetical protein GX455_13420, partial [Phycisphaerae bacterium]|nr:hypothetical protein [Phycisphaerae bacterium]
GLSRKVRSITIAGKTVVFEANHPNDLYEDYNNPQDGPVVSDIKEMTIYAETLIIADRLHLPQTNLTIYARRLQFEGSDALLCTTPHDDRPSSPTPLPGLDAGNITLYVESYSSEEGAIPFLLDGSAGHSGGGAGKPGHLTCTLDKMRPLAWLTPYSVKMILSHARDAYLYGYTAEADDILADYREQITAFMGLETWDSLDPQWQLELEQMFGEIVTLSHRLENGLDYFGNPPGWVPMLSFEVTKAFYEQEIHRAIRVLYLSYWLQNKATAISDKAAALSSSRQAVWGQTQEFADQYAQIQTLIPKLKNDAEQIALRIGYLLGDLQRKEDELMALADRIVQKRHEVPWWKDMLNGLGTIVTSTIEGAAEGGKKGAIEGGIKGTLNVLKDRLFSEPEPWPVITNRIGVDREFNRIDFAAATGEWLDQFSAIPDTLNLIEQNGADSYLQNLREQAASMAGGMNQIKEALKATSLSNEEVETELKAIKAKDPIFNSLVDQVTQLAVEKEVFNRQLSTAMQKVSTLASGITNNLLAIDGMNRDASHLNRVVDPRAALYVKDMERRALERLQKYHYYLARSYEYRLLEPSPMDLNIGKMFTAMETIVSAQGELDAAEFTNLKTIYEEQLWNLTDQIYRDYQENISSEATAPVRLDLSSEQIAALNAGTKVVIDLKNAARFQYNEENLRIVDVQVDRMEFHVEGTYDLQDYFDFEIEHGGVSTLQKDGQMYRFVHYKDVERENNPINWNQRHFADGQWYPVDRSDASQSLLFSLLENCPNAGTGDILLYARPAAWADLILRKIPNEQNSGQLVIDHVRLLIRYDRILRPTQFSALQIVTQPQDLFAYFTVNQPDRYQRQDGVGEFNRTYSTGTTVQATAPLQSGNYAFVKWTDGSGNEVSQNAALSLKLNANTKRIAQYAYTGPTLSVADFNEDSIVDMTDFLGLSNAWLTQPGDADWNPAYDISDPQDQVIDILDLTALADGWLRY